MSSQSPWSAREKPASWILRFLGTSGGTALITVLVGGVFGQIITISWQDRNKQRELSLAAYAEYVKQEQDITRRAYELIGSCIAAADDLMTLNEDSFNLGRYDGEERKKVAVQRDKIREHFNELDQRWRSERETLGLLMGYFHHGQPQVTAAWQQAQDSITTYIDCARKRYLEPPSEGSPPAIPCNTERDAFRQRLLGLTRSFEDARVHAWEVYDQKPPE